MTHQIRRGTKVIVVGAGLAGLTAAVKLKEAGAKVSLIDPGFDPHLRDWLARPHGRIIFAGEHTSVTWQGYMNGAVESGLRAVEKVCAMVLMK